MTNTVDYVFEDVDDQGRPAIVRYTVPDDVVPTTTEEIEAAAIAVAWQSLGEYDRSTTSEQTKGT